MRTNDAEDGPSFFEELFWDPAEPETATERAIRLDVARAVLTELREERERDEISATNASYALMRMVRCAAAQPEDGTMCVGPQEAVRLVDRHGDEITACVHHGARLCASVEEIRVIPIPGFENAALAVRRRARVLRPFPWLRTGVPEERAGGRAA